MSYIDKIKEVRKQQMYSQKDMADLSRIDQHNTNTEGCSLRGINRQARL